MAAMTTALTVFSEVGNTKTYTYTGHTVSKPKLVIQKRKVPTGSQVMQEDTFDVIVATTDALGAILPQKFTLGVSVRQPITGLAADQTAILATFRDIVASDEFAALVTGSKRFK